MQSFSYRDGFFIVNRSPPRTRGKVLLAQHKIPVVFNFCPRDQIVTFVREIHQFSGQACQFENFIRATSDFPGQGDF